MCDISWIEIPHRSSPCRTEVCYRFGRKHRRDRVVNRRSLTTLFGGAVAPWPFEKCARLVGNLSIIEPPGSARTTSVRPRT